MKNELKILGVNGNIYTLEEYLKLPGNTYHYAVGIVFSSPIIGQRVLTLQSWNGKFGEEKVYTELRSESEVIQVVSGLEDTKRIVEAQAHTDAMTAAERCWGYKDGGLQWYLPSLMELGVIYILRDEINEAMKQLGCDSDYLLPTEDSDETWIWSSSEYSQFSSWGVCFGSGNFGSGSKCNTFIIRAIAMLPSTDYKVVVKLEDFKQGLKGIKDSSDTDLVTELRNRGFKGELTKEIKLIV